MEPSLVVSGSADKTPRNYTTFKEEVVHLQGLKTL